MRKIFLTILCSACLAWIARSASGQEPVMLKVRDEMTTFSAVECYVLENGSIYWGEKALGTLFGASIKIEGDNLVILCRDKLCVPFYKDDPQNVTIERKGKPLLLALKAAEAFEYKRLEMDKIGQEIRLYKTPKPEVDKPSLSPFPDIILPETSGQSVPFSKFKEKKLAILVWAPWDKARDSLPAWNRLMGEAGAEVQFVLVAETMEARARLEPYLSILKPRPVCLEDAGFRLAFLYQLKELPSLFLVDEKGYLVWGPKPAKPDDLSLRDLLIQWSQGKPEATVAFGEVPPPPFSPSWEYEVAAKRLELTEVLWSYRKKEEAMNEFQQVLNLFPDQPLLKSQQAALTGPEAIYPSPTPEQGK